MQCEMVLITIDRENILYTGIHDSERYTLLKVDTSNVMEYGGGDVCVTVYDRGRNGEK